LDQAKNTRERVGNANEAREQTIYQEIMQSL
jgi:hypothetical protein